MSETRTSAKLAYLRSWQRPPRSCGKDETTLTGAVGVGPATALGDRPATHPSSRRRKKRRDDRR